MLWHWKLKVHVSSCSIILLSVQFPCISWVLWKTQSLLYLAGGPLCSDINRWYLHTSADNRNIRAQDRQKKTPRCCQHSLAQKCLLQFFIHYSSFSVFFSKRGCAFWGLDPAFWIHSQWDGHGQWKRVSSKVNKECAIKALQTVHFHLSGGRSLS